MKREGDPEFDGFSKKRGSGRDSSQLVPQEERRETYAQPRSSAENKFLGTKSLSIGMLNATVIGAGIGVA